MGAHGQQSGVESVRTVFSLGRGAARGRQPLDFTCTDQVVALAAAHTHRAPAGRARQRRSGRVDPPASGAPTPSCMSDYAAFLRP